MPQKQPDLPLPARCVRPVAASELLDQPSEVGTGFHRVNDETVTESKVKIASSRSRARDVGADRSPDHIRARGMLTLRLGVEGLQEGVVESRTVRNHADALSRGDSSSGLSP